MKFEITQTNYYNPFYDYPQITENFETVATENEGNFITIKDLDDLKRLGNLINERIIVDFTRSMPEITIYDDYI